MEVYRIPISAQRLRGLAEPEQKLLILFGHINNEISILNKFLLWMIAKPEMNEIKRGAANVQSLLMARILAGKIVEAWKVIDHVYCHDSSIRRRYGKRAGVASRDIRIVRKFAQKGSILHRIRNKPSFHYDIKRLMSGIIGTPIKEPLDILLQNDLGNSIFTVAETITTHSLLRGLHKKDRVRATERFIDAVAQASGSVLNTTNSVLGLLLRTTILKDLGDINAYAQRVDTVVSLHDFHIPFFTTR